MREIIAYVLNVHGHACPYGEALGWRRPLKSPVGGRARQGDGFMDQLCRPPLWKGWVEGVPGHLALHSCTDSSSESFSSLLRTWKSPSV